MGILTRFKDIMSANINALLDKCEDPEKMIDQYMRNLESKFYLSILSQDYPKVFPDNQEKN